MKILIMHNSGNVGKSFLAREVFYQNFTSEDKMLLEVESRNSSSSKFNINVKKINYGSADALPVLNHYGIIYDDFIADIGSSEINDFILSLEETREILDEFDFIIIPVTNDQKIIPDTKKTIDLMKHYGGGDKIKVIFNRVISPSNIPDDFDDFIDWAKAQKIDISEELFFKEYKESAGGLLKIKKISGELLQDETDYRALSIKYHKAGDPKKSKEASDALLLQRISKSLNIAGIELFDKFKRLK